MPTWEYKVITSGALGFASPQLLEQHLNQLGKEEWEIIHFQTRPDNPLAFSGLARRPVMRDWVVETPAAPTPSLKSGAVPAPPEESIVAVPTAGELRAEAEERRESLLAREESLRPLRDDASDDDEEEAAAEDSDDWDDEEELPTFFEAIRPHMRRNQRGAGMAVGVEYLAKKFGQTETDLIEALKECGFTIPTSPKDQPVHLEYDGDLYWLNLNSRRQLWINTREKPRAAFRVVTAKKVDEGVSPEGGGGTPEGVAPRLEPQAADAAGDSGPATGTARPAEPLPAGPGLLDRLRPMMRRNRRDPGLSGSVSYLARALKSDPAAVETAFAGLGLSVPAGANDQPAVVAVGDFDYWLNRDRNGQIWINARKRANAPSPEAGATAAAKPADAAGLPAPTAGADAASPVAPEADAGGAKGQAAPSAAAPLAAVRLLLKETSRGGLAAEIGTLAKQLHRTAEELEATLTAAGLKVPAKPREKPVFVEHAGEIFWFNRNARGELWLNAKTSKFAAPATEEAVSTETPGADEEGPAGPRPRRSRKKGAAAPGESPASAASP